MLLTSPIVEGTTPCVTFHEEVSAAAASLEKWEQHLIDVQNSVRDARRLLSTRQLQLAECASSGTDVEGGIEGSGDLHMGRSPAAPVQMLTQPPDVPRKRSESDAESGGNDEEKFVAARCWGANSSFSNPACRCWRSTTLRRYVRSVVGGAVSEFSSARGCRMGASDRRQYLPDLCQQRCRRAIAVAASLDRTVDTSVVCIRPRLRNRP